jgi:hypothetical protein
LLLIVNENAALLPIKSSILVGKGSSPAAVLAAVKLPAENSVWIAERVMGGPVNVGIVVYLYPS